MIKKFPICLYLPVLILPLLSACNTTEGFGKDVKSTGKAIENTAHDAK